LRARASQNPCIDNDCLAGDDMGSRGRRPHLGEAVWRELLARFDRGDESVDAFCEREGLSKSTFNRWRSRGITPRAPTAAAASRVTPTSAGFVDLGALRGSASGAEAGRLEITLELGGGITLRVVRG
jgi:putative transposase